MTRPNVVATIALLAIAGGGIVGTGAARAQFGGGYPEQTGEQLYTHVCQGCHMPDAKGASGAGAYPALAGDAKLAAKMYPVLILLRGQKAMPAFADLTDAQIAEVTNYIRGHFGNAFPGSVTADEVKALRPKEDRQGQFRAG